MASNTKKTKAIRARHKKNMGRARKRHARNHGTTPVFPIHVEAHKATEGKDS